MYRSFFGLNQLPFKISQDLNFFYKNAAREDIANAVLYSITRGDGIVKVVGEVGVGKTTLLRLVASKLPDSYHRVFVSAPNLSAADFIKLICNELGIPLPDNATKHNVLKLLTDYLINEHAHKRRVVLLIDEAQSMTLDTLEEIRLFGNMENDTDKLIQIVLCGQPELDITLNDERIRPLKDRIACEVNIPPLEAEEVMRYLNYRMRVAGNLDEEVFNLKVAQKIQSISKGLPRKINLIADKLLMAAFSAGDRQIESRHFANIGAEFQGSKKFYEQPWVLLVLAVSFAGLVFAGYQHYFAPSVNIKTDVVDNTENAEVKKTIPPVEEGSVDNSEVRTIDKTSEQAVILKKSTDSTPRTGIIYESSDSELYRKAYKMMELNQYEQAIAGFNRVLDVYPGSSLADNAAYWVAEIYIVLDDEVSAARYFRKVVVEYPDSSKASASLLRYGDVLTNLGQNREAIKQYQLLISDFPDSDDAVVAKRRLNALAN